MKGARTLKELSNRTWFRNRKGGQDTKLRKETPWIIEGRARTKKAVAREVETRKRKRKKKKKEERETNRCTQRSKSRTRRR